MSSTPSVTSVDTLLSVIRLVRINAVLIHHEFMSGGKA